MPGPGEVHADWLRMTQIAPVQQTPGGSHVMGAQVEPSPWYAPLHWFALQATCWLAGRGDNYPIRWRRPTSHLPIGWRSSQPWQA